MYYLPKSLNIFQIHTHIIFFRKSNCLHRYLGGNDAAGFDICATCLGYLQVCSFRRSSSLKPRAFF